MLFLCVVNVYRGTVVYIISLLLLFFIIKKKKKEDDIFSDLLSVCPSKKKK
jgi:hypothetical protein